VDITSAARTAGQANSGTPKGDNQRLTKHEQSTTAAIIALVFSRVKDRKSAARSARRDGDGRPAAPGVAFSPAVS